MKNRNGIIRCFILLITLGLLTQACTKGFTPTAPVALAVSNATPTPVISAGVSEIYWYSARIYRYNVLGSSTDTLAEVYLSVKGQAETTDQVVLSGGKAPVTLPYSETLNVGGNDYARYFLDGGAFTYQPGATYTLSTVTTSGTAWASLTLPGGINCPTTGDWSKWNFEGNNDSVYVETTSYSQTYNSLDTQADVDSIFKIPLSAFPSQGAYYVRTACKTVVNTVNNALTGSSLEATDEMWNFVNR